MKVKKIYFDMDGVLADFERGVREICCLEPIPQDAKNNDSQDVGGYQKGREFL